MTTEQFRTAARHGCCMDRHGNTYEIETTEYDTYLRGGFYGEITTDCCVLISLANKEAVAQAFGCSAYEANCRGYQETDKTQLHRRLYMAHSTEELSRKPIAKTPIIDDL